jgi:hypothetical protein
MQAFLQAALHTFVVNRFDNGGILLVCFYVGASRRKFVYTALAVFILFSGMDAIGFYSILNRF